MRRNTVVLGLVFGLVVLVAFGCQPASAPAVTPTKAAPTQVAPSAAATATPVAKPSPAPTLPPTVQAKKGGTLHVAQPATTPNLDPIRSVSYLTNNPISLIYNRLVKFQRGTKGLLDIQIVPELAERWETSQDQLTWTFYLRKGVKWANAAPMNGRELTADDVVWSFDQMRSHPEAPQKAKFAAINTIEAVDKSTVRFRLKTFYAQFLHNLASEPAWVLPKEVEQQVGSYKTWMVGSGPFIMTQYNPSAGMTYKKNPDYFDADKVYIDDVDWLVIADTATRIASLRAGKLDILGTIGSPSYLTPSQMADVKKTNPNITFEELPGQGPKLEIRFGAKPFDDLRVRQAVNYALNRDGFIATIAEGKGQYDGTFPYARFQEFALPQEELKKYLKHDPELSKKLLAEAGFPNGLTAIVKWCQACSFPTAVDLYIAQLGAVGIKLDAKPEQVDYPAWVSQTFSGKFTQLAAWAYTTGGPWDYFYGLHHSTGQRNGPQTSVPQVDAWLDDAIHTPDKAKQVELVQKVERWALTEGLYILPTTTITAYWAWQPWVKDFPPVLSGAYENSAFAYLWLDK